MRVTVKYHTEGKKGNFAEETYELELSGDDEAIFKRVVEFDQKHTQAEDKFGTKKA